MKIFIFCILAFTVMAMPPLKKSWQTNKKAKINNDRKLTIPDIQEQHFMQNTNKISIDYLQQKIKNMHKSIKACLQSAFDKDKIDHLIDFDYEVENCVGHSFSIITNFYNTMLTYEKEIMKDEFKCQIREKICKENLDACLEILAIIESLANQGIDIIKALILNKEHLYQKFGEHNIRYIINNLESDIEDSNSIRKALSQERIYLQSYLQQNFQTISKRHKDEQISSKILHITK